VHSADTLRFVLDDEVQDVTAIGSRQGLAAPGVVDNVMSVLRFGRGTLAGVHDSFTVPANTTSLEIYGSEGSVFGHGVIAQSPAGSVELRRDGTSEPIDPGPDVDPYVDTIAAFGAAVRGEGAPRCSGEDGLLNVKVALAVAAAAREAGV
jgi:1,5-anhydro-D-fructose reductase (1,5-anhydro-D-mannitol-forming)